MNNNNDKKHITPSPHVRGFGGSACFWVVVGVVAIACACFVAFYLHRYVSPVLAYLEGWHTFFWDWEFVRLTADEQGWGAVLQCFLLQFYAHPWHGVAVTTALIMAAGGIAYAVSVAVLRRMKWGRAVSSVVAMAVLAGITLSLPTVNSDSGRYMMLSNYARHGQWEDIISECKSHGPVTNLLHQNLLNMALAETLQLGNQLLDEPVQDIRSIYVDEVQGAEVAALLSDIYFSMGHIAQSQRYAFEANEKMYNFSPRLLQRLYNTNRMFRQFKVAEKYNFWLQKTLYYKGKVTVYGKGHCIFPDNRFSGINGLDDDLLNIARNTRGTHECRVTLQYLGALYILAGYREQFVSMINEFGGSKDLPRPLPKYFDKYYKHCTSAGAAS